MGLDKYWLIPIIQRVSSALCMRKFDASILLTIIFVGIPYAIYLNTKSDSRRGYRK